MEDAQKFLASIPVPQRQCLEQAVLDTRKKQESDKDVTPPTWKQLKLCEQRSFIFLCMAVKVAALCDIALLL